MLGWDITCNVDFLLQDRFANPTDIVSDTYEYDSYARAARWECIERCRAKHSTLGRLLGFANTCIFHCLTKWPESDIVGRTFQYKRGLVGEKDHVQAVRPM